MSFSVIFGAGKIARGFIAHLLTRSQAEFVFVEKAQGLVDLLNTQGRYTIRILGAPEKDAIITGARALSYADRASVTAAIARADMVFTAVGGKNLPGIAPMLAEGIVARFDAANPAPLNLITCENWKQPADLLRAEILRALVPQYRDRFEALVGTTEAVVMRSAIEAEPDALAIDPLVVNVQDYWVLPVDAARIRGTLPPVEGIQPIDAFSGFLERKFYTYNAANGTTSFLGYIRGHKYIADAARDPGILEVLEGVYLETGTALSRKHGIPLDEQMTFTRTSLQKLQDRTIVDYIERNARDPLRKLGPDDRLVGSARLCLEQGVQPVHLAIAIAAALYYDEPSDAFAQDLKRMREECGIDAILRDVCRIDPEGELAGLVKDGIHRLRQMAWIKGDE